MLYFPHAKINIGLSIIAKRADGFHDLETVFLPVGVYDALELLPDPSANLPACGLQTYGLPISGPVEDNLILRAYELLAKDFPQKLGAVSAFLIKNIPMGAGLGGGSADGALMLRLLNDYFQLGLAAPTLASYAAQLGSDCSFFLQNTPCFASGRGECLQPVNLDLAAFCLQLVCPSVHCSTAEAYRSVQPKKPAFDSRKIADLPLAEWKNYLFNDFEPILFQKYPELAGLKRQLYEQGALYAAMSGSGSCIYGIFPKGRTARLTTSLPVRTFYVPAGKF